MNNYNLLEKLCQEIGCECLKDESMSKYTTFKVGRNAELIVFPSNYEQLSKLVKLCNENNYLYYILGKGSNLLFKDSGDNFIIISTANIKGLSLNDNMITAKAGEHMSTFCSFALTNELSGVEFAWGIPGTVGGAVYMNAGAYGGEIKDIIESVKVINKKGEILTISKKAMCLEYRKSIFQNDEFVILEATFYLNKDKKENIKDKMNDFISRRKDKQPLDYPSAGSTFKRPEGTFAAQLIDECGLKGKSVGGAMVSEKHAGFIINYNNATATDILNLINEVKNEVKEKTGYTLECEVKIL